MTKRRPIFIFGVGGYAKCIFDACRLGETWEVVAFVDRGGVATQAHGIPVLQEERFLAAGGDDVVVIGVGDNDVRAKIADALSGRYTFGTVIHPGARISPDARIGEGAVLLAGSLVNIDAILDPHVSIWSHAIVEHDCHVHAAATLAPGATLGGNVTIGARAFLGMGATVNQGLNVGHDTVVGAQSAVIQSLPAEVVAVGAPARSVRPRRRGDRYL